MTKKEFIASGVFILIFTGCVTPNNSLALSQVESSDLVKKASLAQDLKEFGDTVGYSKKDNYYTFVDKGKVDSLSISWRTFSAFCRAKGGILGQDPRFAEIKINCPNPLFANPPTKEHRTNISYCKIPEKEDATKMSAKEILYIMYSTFKGDYVKHGDRIDVAITDDASILSSTKDCYNNAYKESLIYLEKKRIREEQIEKEKAIEKQKALEKQNELEREKLAQDKKLHDDYVRQHAEYVKQIEAFRNSQLREEVMTNCGPILEVKKTMIKIYFPVSGYGSEHWISKNEIYPEGFGCSFTNGRYAGPTLRY